MTQIAPESPLVGLPRHRGGTSVPLRWRTHGARDPRVGRSASPDPPGEPPPVRRLGSAPRHEFMQEVDPWAAGPAENRMDEASPNRPLSEAPALRHDVAGQQ